MAMMEKTEQISTTISSNDWDPELCVSGPKPNGTPPTPGEEDVVLFGSEPHRVPTHKHQPEQWNKPLINLLRTGATAFSFTLLGINDAAYGALIPYIEEYYNTSYTVTSLIFLMPVVGNIVATLSCHYIHIKLGQRGVAILGPIAHLITYIVVAMHPPYPALICMFMIVGFGQGISNAAWNARASKLDHINEVLGVLHACFGLGAVISPLIATAMVTKGGCPWYEFYYLMIGLAVTELALLASTFWSATGEAFRRENPHEDLASTADDEGSDGNAQTKNKSPMKQALSSQPVWLVACFFFLYSGIEVGIGGWVVTFMMDVRNAPAFPAGMTATGYWLGLTVGRVILGFVTGRVFRGVRWAVTVYFVFTLALELVFWLVPNFYASAVAVAWIGFFVGPMSPAVFAAVTTIMPKHLHMPAVGFATAFGTGGGAVLPFAVGALAQAKGVSVLHPWVVVLVVVVLLIWLRIGVFLGTEGREKKVKATGEKRTENKEGNSGKRPFGWLTKLKGSGKGN